MKNSSKYIFIFASILFFNIVIASNNKVFREDFDQEEGLKLLNKLNNSFNDFEISFRNYQREDSKDQSSILSISRNRIKIALRSAELTKELEKEWNIKDQETISLRKIQKTTWENSKVYLIPHMLTRFERNNPFGTDILNLEDKAYQTHQKNLEELAKIMKEKGDREEKEEAKVYFKYKKLEEYMLGEMMIKFEEGIPDTNYCSDFNYEECKSKQIDSLKKLRKLAFISSIENLPTALDYDTIINNLSNQKFPLFNELKNLQSLADEMVKIYFD